NGFDEAEWEGVETGTSSADKFRITYAGELYMGRNPLPVFRALRVLIDAREIDPAKIEVELVGWCETAEGQRVAEMVKACDLSECVSVRGPLSRPITLRKLAKSGLLLLFAEELTLQIPGKTYEYLRAGRPILALTTEGAVAELLRKTGAG